MDTNKTEKMFDLVDQWKASGKTQKAFCHNHGIKVATFGYWVGKKKRSDEPGRGGFALVDLTGDPSGWQVELTYPNGVVVGCPADPVLIGRLIHLV